MAGWGDGGWGDTHWGGERVGATYIDTNTTLAAGTTTWTVETVVSAGTTLTFPPASSATLVMDNKNLIVYGTLKMHPASYSVEHRIQEINVNEQVFVGAPPPKGATFVGDTSWNIPGKNMGSMIPSTTDIGIWVMETGVADLVGSPRAGWNRTGTDPTWQAGDSIQTVPFSSGNYNTMGDHYRNGVLGFYADGFKPATDQLQSVVGPDGVTYVQECVNLTRNVIIGGTSGHRTHFLIMTPNVTQVIKYARFEFMGPRHINTDGSTSLIRGRWAGAHFHHLMDSVGSRQEGCVVAEGTAHAYVAHDSHHVVFYDCIAYHTADDAFWWDNEKVLNGNHIPALSNSDYTIAPDQLSHDNLYDHCMAVRGFMPAGESTASFVGYNLQGSSGNNIQNCVTVGNLGTSSAAGVVWPESAGGRWENADLVMHNNQGRAAYIWQNTGSENHVTHLVGYRNGLGGITQGAYNNGYHYSRCVCFQNAGSGDVSTDFVHAAVQQGPGNTVSYHQVIQDCWFGDYGVIHHVATGNGESVAIRNNHLGNFRIDEWRPPGGSQFRHSELDYIENDLEEPEDFCNQAHPHAGNHTWIFVMNGIDSAPPKPATGDPLPSKIRIQRADGTAWQAKQVGTSHTDWMPLDIAPFAFSILPQTLTSGTQGLAYSDSIDYMVGNGAAATAPIVFGLKAGSNPLPPGVSLSTTGVLSGTPTTAGTYTPTFEAVEVGTQRARRTLTINVGSSASLQVTTSSLPGGTKDSVYAGATLAASGGFPPYTFSVVSGSLPPGLTLTGSTGHIAGTPTTAGTYTPTFRVTDSVAATAQRALSIAVLDLTPVISVVNLQPGEIGVGYTQLMAATGGVPPYTWVVDIGPLPTGITMASNGQFSGTPDLTGEYPVRLRVTESGGHAALRDYILTVYDALSVVSPQSLPGAPVGQLYAASVFGTGGAPPLSFTGEDGLPQPFGIPPGIEMSVDGEFAGFPTTMGVYVFNVSVTDVLNESALVEVSIEVTEMEAVVELSREIQLGFALRRPHGGSRMRDRV